MPFASTLTRSGTGGSLVKTGSGAGTAVTVPAGAVIYSAPAGEEIGSGRIVRLSGGRAWLADPACVFDPEPILGLTQTAAAVGEAVTVVRAGVMIGFVGLVPAAPYFLGADGVPVTEPPATGWWLRVGVAQSSTVLFVSLSILLRR